MSKAKKNNGAAEQDPFDVQTLVGIDSLRRTLERDFYAVAGVEVQVSAERVVNLIIQLDCNFGLTESLFHLNNGNWGSFRRSGAEDRKSTPFHTALYELSSLNEIPVEIKEFSFHLKDCSITISKVPHHLIEDRLETIFDSVSGSFVHFTKGLTQMPYEIFIPVYEETGTDLSGNGQEPQNKADYLGFWGLYFEGNDESCVYDVKNKEILEQSDFFLLNDWE